MSNILTLPPDTEEYEDTDEVLEAAVEDAEDVSDEYKSHFPPEYVVGILGHRGGGKTALMAYFLLNCLAAGEEVFTNLNLYPDKVGIKKQPHPLDQDSLLQFDKSIEKAVLGIEEVGMWYERRRGMSTTTIIQDKWLQLVIRKMGIRAFYTNQSPLLHQK